MAHGTPDWGVTAGAVTVYQMTDLGELAARLGSIVTFDRRGDVIFLDDFEDGWDRFVATASGGGWSVGLSAAHSQHGRYSVRLVPGNSYDTYAGIMHESSLPTASPLGVEVSFTVQNLISAFSLGFDFYDGVNYFIFNCRWSRATKVLQVFDNAGNWVDVLSNVSLYNSDRMFNTLKVVANPSSGYYMRARLNDQQVDLSDYFSATWSSVQSPQLCLSAIAYGTNGQNPSCYVDDVILTQNEPAQP